MVYICFNYCTGKTFYEFFIFHYVQKSEIFFIMNIFIF